MAIEGPAFEQGALAQMYGGLFQLLGREIEPTVAGIRSAGQIGAAQASALGQQLAAQTGAAAQLGVAQTGAQAQQAVAQTRLQGTLAQIAGQIDLQTTKGQQEWEQLTKKLTSQETVAEMQAEANKYGSRLQKEAQLAAAETSAGATKEAATTQAGASMYGSEQSRAAQEAAALTSAGAQKFGATTSAEAQKAVAALNIAGQLGGGDFGQGIIGAQSAAKQAEALQQLQAQMGLGDDTGEGIIRKQQQEQLGRELALSQEQAAQQLGTGDYAGGGLIGAQSAAKIAEMQEAGRQKLGTPYSTLGEIAGTGIEQRMTQEQRAALARQNMQAHADMLDVQQGKISNRLAGITTPFADMFGLGQGPGSTGQAASGFNVPEIIAGAGRIFPQTTAMNLVSGAGGNPFMQPLTGLAGITGAQNTGQNQLLARKGLLDAQNTLGLAANQNLAQMGLGAAKNLAGSFNQGLATQTSALQPLSTATGQGLAAIPQAQGQALAAMGGIGAGAV